jgi:hypothetical protein
MESQEFGPWVQNFGFKTFHKTDLSFSLLATETTSSVSLVKSITRQPNREGERAYDHLSNRTCRAFESQISSP